MSGAKPFLSDEEMAQLEAAESPAPAGKKVISDAEMAALEAEEAKFGGGLAPVAAGLAGAARGISFGLSDLAAAGVGLDDELAKLKEYNPASSVAGEITGAIAPAIATMGASTGATAAGIGARGAISGAARMAPTMLVEQGGKAVAKKLGGGALARAAGMAAEGAAYGVGQTVSEASLAQQKLDAEDLGEILVSNVGLGALTGGLFSLGASGVGAGVRGAKGQIKKLIGKAAGSADEVASPLDLLVREGAESGVGPKSSETVSAARALGLEADQLPRRMTTDDRLVKQAGDYLVESPGTFAGKRERSRAVKVMSTLKEAAETGVLDNHLDDTVLATSQDVVKSLDDTLKTRIKPLEEAYDQLEKSLVGAQIPESARKRVAKNIMDLESVTINPRSTGAAAAREYSEALLGITDLNQLKQLRSQVGDEIRDITTSVGKRDTSRLRVLEAVNEKMSKLRESWLEKSIRRSGMDSFEAQQLAEKSIEELRGLNKSYAMEKKFIGDLAESLNLPRASSSGEIVRRLEAKNDQDLLRQVFNVKDMRSLQFLRKEMPDVFGRLQARFKNDLYKKSLVKGDFSPSKFIRNVRALKFGEDMTSLVFGDSQAYLLKNIETVADSLPEKFFKGSADYLAWQESMGITGAVIRNMKDEALSAAIDLAPRVRKAIENQDTQINDQLRRFFKSSGTQGKALILKGTLSTSEQEVQRIDDIMKVAADPDKLVELLAEGTAGLQEMDDGVNSAALETAMRAATYLAEKAPKQPSTGDLFGEAPYKPSDAEIAQFNRYLKAIDEPMSLLEDLKGRVLQPESVEALSVVYPRLYEKIKAAAMSYVGNVKSPTYADKLQLSVLLQMPVNSTMSPDFIAAMQADFSNPLASDQEVKQGNVTGLKEVSLAQSNQTSVQQTLIRKMS